MTTPNGSILGSAIESDLVERGSRVQGGKLLEQAGATFEIARQHKESLEGVLPQGLLEEGEAARQEVEAGIQSRENVAAETKDAKREQDSALKSGRRWGRQVVALARMVIAVGLSVPDALTKLGRSWRKVSTALEAFARAIGLLKENAEKFKAFPLYNMVVNEGETLAARLALVDATQEAKRISELPEAVRRYYLAKGKLLAVVRIVTEAGRAAFAGDRKTAKRFTLSILQRRGRKGKDEAPSTPEPQPNPV
ncbi:MAG: hypothetical protein HY720_18650 [Planctomycetes bacterium]|nr:hypothetical protein [Planctomycetota bacterium]